jgi:tetratricopeptide (TPR) repeat protein
VPGGGGVRDELRHDLDEAERQQVIVRLHDLANRVRFGYPCDDLSGPERDALRRACLAIWGQRDRVRDRRKADAQVRADLLDVAVVSARLVDGAEAEAVLNAAEVELGASPVLDQERGAVRPGAAAPKTAWEHYAVGRCLLRAGDLPGAARHLDEAVRQEPGGLWPNFYRGQCAYLQERYADAVTHFSVCVGAAPGQPAPYVNRGRAHAALGHKAAARTDCDQALRLDKANAAAQQLRADLEAGPK